jgi:2-dehydro-3-deoxyphosphogluconate aldolase / (4S)-4-hydroxy-2-oxoglutarate aldolase
MTLDDIMQLGPVIPVLTVERAEDAVPLAQALVGAGLRVLEVTLRTPAALEVIGLMAEVEGAVVGAGTVLNRSDLEAAAEAGAKFIVSPGLTDGVVAAATEVEVPLLPGVATAGEIMRGLDLGLSRFKFFPAATSGGPAAVRAFAGPFAQVRFCPTGGISYDAASEYLRLPNVACIGGTWITPAEAINAGDWSRIGELARAAARLDRTG